MTGRYLNRFMFVLKDFNLATAEALSDELKDAEDGGYELSPPENMLWYELTGRIWEAKNK